MKRSTVSLLLVLTVLTVSCSLEKLINRNLGNGKPTKLTLDSALQGFGHNAGKGAMLGLNGEVSNLSRNLIASLKHAVDSLDPLDPLTIKVKRQVDSLGRLTNAQVDSIGQTVLAKVVKLKREVKDEELKRFFLDAITKAGNTVDRKTRPLLSNMLDRALDDLNTDTTRAKIAAFRDSTLNAATQHKLQETIRLSLQPTVDTLTARIRSIVHNDLPVVQKYATQFLIGLGTMLSAIIAWVWYQRRKYLRLVKLLTNQIHQIPDTGQYDELVGRIRKKAQETSLEPALRDVLHEQGINQ